MTVRLLIKRPFPVHAEESRRLRGVLEYAKLCRELADRTPNGTLRHAMLRTATISEEFALRLEQPSFVKE